MSFWESCKLDTKYQKVYAWVFGFSLLYIGSILLINFYYGDDIHRSIDGLGWNHDGRIFLSWIAYIVNGHRDLMDISPWSQILAVAIFDYGLICWIRKLIPEASVIKSAIVAAFAYVNLFLLQNLVYRYDSLGMMFGLGLVFFLYALPHNWSKRKKTVISVIVVFAILYIYQAILGAYIALAIFDAFILIKDGASKDELAEALIPRIIGVVIGIILWKLVFIAVVSDYLNSYSNDHAGLVSVATLGGLKNVYHNLIGYAHMFKEYFSTIKWVEILLMTAMCAGLLRIAYNVWCESSQKKRWKIARILFVLLTPGLLVAASIAPLVFLKSPVYMPRVLISFTVFTVFQGYIIYTLSKYCSKIWVISLLTLVITLSHAAYFGNLVNCQYKFNEDIAQCIVSDINDIEKENGIKFDKLSNIGPNEIKCRELLLAKKGKPIYDRMVYCWFEPNYHHYRMRLTKYVPTKKEEIQYKEPDRSNEFYKLYVVGDKIVVVFEKR